MIWEKLQGVDVVQQMFDQVGNSAQEELAVELGIISRDFLAWQQAAAPKDTGLLAGSLSIWVMVDQLRARIGIIGAKGSRGQGNMTKAYYGRFVQFGRKAQTVLVQRRRRVGGKLRSARGRKVASDIVSTYSLRVKPREPRNFIFPPDANAIVAQRLADFWANALQRAGV